MNKIANINFSNKFQEQLTSKAKKSITIKKSLKSICLMGLVALSSINMACLNNNKQISNKNSNDPIYENYQPKNIEKKYGKYGKYYVNNIPDIENKQIHAELLDKLSCLTKQIQGCSFTNPAFLNGLSAQELQDKVVTPAQEINAEIPFGKSEKTLILIGFETGLDDKQAFENDFKNKNMTK